MKTKILIKKLLRESLVTDEINAFHGTSQDFDKFSTDKMGSGEGNQVFGWGLYFTNIKDIAKVYQSGISCKTNYELWVDDTNLEGKINQLYKQADRTNNNEKYDLLMDIIDILAELKSTWNYAKAIKATNNPKAIQWVEKNVKPYVEKDLGKCYNVTIHKGKTPNQYHYIDWEKNVDELTLNKIITQAKKESIYKEIDGVPSISIDYGGEYPLKMGLSTDLKNEDLYRGLTYCFRYNDKDASMFLLRAGIDGIRYITNSLSRFDDSEFESGYNYVVFDEHSITINSKEL